MINTCCKCPHLSKGKVQIDKKKATGRITALIAQSQGGVNGKILGGILDAALSQGGEITPPPTTQPFPWKDSFTPPSNKVEEKIQEENSIEPTVQNEGKKKKKKKKGHKQDVDNPLKDIEEGAIQILDSLFRPESRLLPYNRADLDYFLSRSSQRRSQNKRAILNQYYPLIFASS